MSDHNCIYEERWGKVLTKLEMFTEVFCKHIEEGEAVGGYRDRLLVCEKEAEVARQVALDTKKEISVIKKGYWKACLVSGLIGGIIGGLLGKIAIQVYEFIVKLITIV